MFSGIVECQSPIVKLSPRQQVVEIDVEKPPHFNDLKRGDSICVNGVCLTLENMKEGVLTFALAGETLRVVQWPRTFAPGVGHYVNLERSLRFSDRIHGHLVSGHVDGVAEVRALDWQGEMSFLRVRYPKKLQPFVCLKGSITLNGVSLTVNELNDEDSTLCVCLIPETLKCTNLSKLKVGDGLNIETDLWARQLARMRQVSLEMAAVTGCRQLEGIS